MADKTYTVTVASGNLYGGGTGNVYYIDGARSSTGPGNIIWAAGSTLRFEQSDASNDGHPLIFSTTTSRDQIISSNVTYYLDGASNQASYTNTMTFNAATTRYVEIDVSAPDFYYLCYVHGIGMGGLMDVATGKTWSVGTWGLNQWGDQTDPNIQITGQALSANIGSVSISGEINAGWGRLTWGENAWGEQGDVVLSGLSMSTSLGSLSIEGDVDAPVTGLAITGATGSLSTTSATEVFPSGFALTNTLGTADAGPDAMATGNQATLSLGTVEAFNQTGWGRQQWNVNAWGVEGQFANVDVTGIAMTADEGTLDFSGNSSVSLTGFALTANEGTADVAPDAEVTGLQLSASLGSVSLTGNASVSLTGFALTNALGTAVFEANTIGAPSGLALTMQEGDPINKVSVDVSLTGLGLTGSLGSVYNLIWNEVNTGTTVTWREVDTAA
tara:strand:- start:185 stop:1516 length:1332 start_codon:yes stop_codon:yes gene_type:complete